MKRVNDRAAKRAGMRIIDVPIKGVRALNVLNRQTGWKINAQLRRAVKNYPGADGRVRIDSFKPVPSPDYEQDHGGQYSHIIKVRYCKRWGCVFGLRTNGKIVLWMD